MVFPSPKISRLAQCLIRALLSGVWLCVLCFPTAAEPAGMAAPQMISARKSASDIPENLAAQEVDAYLAGLTDEQARQLLAYKLKMEATQSLSPEKTDEFTGRSYQAIFFRIV